MGGAGLQPMKKLFLSALTTAAGIVPALAGDGAAAPSDGLREGVLQAIHLIGHALGLI
jgi:hypothetical protein